MNFLLLLTIHGSIATVMISLANLIFRKTTSTKLRRVWWLLVPVTFLVTIPLPVLPASRPVVLSAKQPVALLQALPTAAESSEVLSSSDVGTHVHPMNLQQQANPSPTAFLKSAELLSWTSVSQYLEVAWAIGFGIGLVLIFFRVTQTHWFWSHQVVCADPQLLKLLETCKSKVGIRTSIDLILSEQVTVPAILGGFQTRLLVPKALIASLSEEELCSIFLHELAHYRSGDLFWTWAFLLVATLHWFNPFAHGALRSWRYFIEESADERALSLLPGRPEAVYGEVLLKSLQHAHSCPPFGAFAITESLSQLKQRIMMIKNHNKRTQLRRPLLVSLVFFLLLFSVIFPFSRAQKPAPLLAPKDPAKSASTDQTDMNRILENYAVWKELDQVVNPQNDPVNLLTHFLELKPKDSLNVWSFSYNKNAEAVNRLKINGESKNVATAYQFRKILINSPAFKNYKWNHLLTTISPNDYTTFTLSAEYTQADVETQQVIFNTREIWKKRTKEIQDHQPVFTDESDQATVLEMVTTSARAAGLEVQYQALGGVEDMISGKEVRVRVTIKGLVQGICKWLADLEKPESFFSIDYMELHLNMGDPKVVCSLNMCRYFKMKTP